MNSLFDWQEQYLTDTTERSKLGLLLLPREHKIHIFELTCELFFLLYKHTDDGIFDDFEDF